LGRLSLPPWPWQVTVRGRAVTGLLSDFACDLRAATTRL
jgi:hypothetical protein